MKIQCNVAGITFRNGSEEFTTMQPKGTVGFIHDPKNEYDPNAVEVWYGGVHIGYVKRDSFAQEFLKDHPDIAEAKIKKYSYAEKIDNDLVFNDDHKGRLSSVSFEIEHGSDDVTMSEDNNYIIDKQEYQRLSNVLKYGDFDPDSPGLDMWKINHKDYDDYRADLNDRARAGTAMHNIIERAIETGQDDMELPAGFLNFKKKHVEKFLDVEQVVRNESLGIAGRYDAKAIVKDGRDKKRVIIDWKSSKKSTLKQQVQASFYAYMSGCEEAWIVCLGAKNKQGYSLTKVSKENVKRYCNAIGHLKSFADLINA